jgi:hypothetical protein
VAGVVLGLVLGLGAPAFYINRTERDEERLEELRALNRAQYQETGEYMSDVSAQRLVWCPPAAAAAGLRVRLGLPFMLLAVVRAALAGMGRGWLW